MDNEKKTYIPVSQLDKDYFNKYADGYSPYTQGDLEFILSGLVSTAGERPKKWCCEVGSADGQFSTELARRMPELFFVGIDIAEKVLRKYPFEKICGSAFQFPVKTGSIEMLVCPASFHHLSPFADSLAEMNRVLAPGGVVFFMEPNWFHPQRRFFMANHRIYHKYRQANDVPVNPRTLADDLEKLGIRTVQLQYINLEFNNPSRLQRIQTFISRIPWPQGLLPYIMPWFILIGEKVEHGR